MSVKLFESENLSDQFSSLELSSEFIYDEATLIKIYFSYILVTRWIWERGKLQSHYFQT